CGNAIGRPGLAARYSAVSATATVIVTGPAAFVGGAVGAAVAVCLVQAGALIYFLRLLRLEVPDLDRGGSVMHLPSAVAAAAVAGAGGWVSLSWGARSPASLLVALAAVGLGFLAYAALNWRWLGPLRARPGSSAGA
nr:polysaccharide biosynthesis C-terminal domain-containing protein [Dermatophilaceae bacterium]